MRLFFSLVLIFFLCKPVFSNSFQTKYLIKNRGITIGSLIWELNIEKDLYFTLINLKNEGLLSNLYAFEGKYKSNGKIINNRLSSTEYNQHWKTKKNERFVQINFKNIKIDKVTIVPKEMEYPRIDYKELENYNDPLTSFLNIILNKEGSFTIDGRRVYFLSPIQKEGFIRISINEYRNIWADHKRNDLEYIEIFLEKDLLFPKKIKIMFKDSVFSLNKI